MKRTLLIVALVLAISTSIIAGTLAMYAVEIDDLAEGNVLAKEFILTEGGRDSFETGVKIAPGETIEWDFSVKNYDGSLVSETAMDLDFVVSLTATDGKEAIVPLVVTVKDVEANVAGETGAIEFSDEFALEDAGQEKTYTVSIQWPWETEGIDDIDYAGGNFGTDLTVSVTATQK